MELFNLVILLQVILDTLGLAHLYGFLDLEAAISDYLREILNIKNVCLIIDTAFLYQLEFLTRVSITCLQTSALELFGIRYTYN